MSSGSRVRLHSATASSGDIRLCPYDSLRGHLCFQGCSTLLEVFERSCRLFGDHPCLGERVTDHAGRASPFVFKSYAEVHSLVLEMTSGFQINDLVKKNGYLGISMKNSSYWIIAEQACYQMSAITVPLYDTLGRDAVAYIINQIEMETILCSLDEVSSLIAVKDQCPSLRHIIVTSAFTRDVETEAEALGLRLHTVLDVLQSGGRSPCSLSPPSSQNLCTICYTSGTTGVPKGAMLTHGNLVSAAAGGLEAFMRVTDKDCYLSFLPLAHIFERLAITAVLCCGGAVGFSRGSPLLLVEDLQALQPTIFCAVPRLLSRIHDKIAQRSEGTDLASRLLRSAISTKLHRLKTQGSLSHLLFDSLVFARIRASLGLNRVRFLLRSGPYSTG